ncbi:hypothetical protein [Micromonospora sp. NBC_00898]|uniref:hypothetical protein n=1 Tax=Micromonospora sp. NBC_00898 TaxID=2975981 RepID=UPI003870E8B7
MSSGEVNLAVTALPAGTPGSPGARRSAKETVQLTVTVTVAGTPGALRYAGSADSGQAEARPDVFGRA